MRYLSVCSGIEAATVAWHPLGWKPTAFAEIEKFPSKVLAHHYPHVPNLGDMTNFKEWEIGSIDLLVGGTPCQSFSVAGLRKGLDDPRGNLMLTFLAIAKRFSPRWLVWENVPGVLSSNGGRDFGSFLGGLAHCGYGFGYRVLDAQYFGVAQRRRRVFVVGCLGDWRRAAAVLFERNSLSGNPAPSREKRKVTPTLSSSGTGVSRVGFNCEDEWFIETPVARTLDTECGGLETDFDPDGGVITMAHGQGGAEIGFDRGPTLTCNHEAPIAFVQNSRDEVHFMGGDGRIVGALAAEAGAKQQCYVAFTTRDYKDATDLVAQPIIGGWDYENNAHGPNEVTGPLLKGSPSGGGRPLPAVMLNTMQVRRLTPVECERLQGFPDNYTNIPNAADGPRYKALGNSMAVPVMHWIGKRIQMVEGIC